MKVRDAVLVGLSLANLLWLKVWDVLLEVPDRDAYHLKIAAADYWAAIAGVTLVGLALAAVALAVDRAERPRLRAVARAAFLVLLISPALFAVDKLSDGPAATALAHPAALVGGLVLGNAGAWWIVLRARAAARVARVALLALSPFVLVTFGRAGLALSEGPTAAYADATPPAPVARAAAPARRVLLVVLDELDRGVALTHRPPGLAMPNLDRLRAESIDAPALPPAHRTMLSVPILLTGEPWVRTRHTGPRELALVAEGGRETAWSGRPTLFTDARARGVATGVAGWYHPYCRILADDLDRCVWGPYWPSLRGQDQGFAGALAEQVLAVAAPRRVWWNAMQIDVYRRLLASGAEMAADPALGLVYVHLPVPHAPGIWDAGDGSFAPFLGWPSKEPVEEAYRANLALADRALGELRRAMEASGTWETTTVIVTSDHPLRGGFPGRSDPVTVPYLVRLPGGSGLAVADTVDARSTRNLVQALLSREVSPAEAIALLTTSWVPEKG